MYFKIQFLFKNVFMGVAIDTYDKESGIHPRNKQLSSKRLALAGLNVAYGMSDYPTNGPFPQLWNFAQVENGYQVDIMYDKPFIWDVVESEGFYICCLDSIDECNSIDAAWEKVQHTLPLFFNCFFYKHIQFIQLPDESVSFDDQTLSMNLPSCAVGLAYLWETTPVLGTRALPMYADDEFGLPGAPWIKDVTL